MTEPLPQTPSDWRRVAEAAPTPEAALAAWREYLWLRPDDVDALLACGEAAQKLGDMKEAVEAWQRALRLDRAHEGITTALVSAWLDLAEWDKAAALLRHWPDHPLQARLSAERGQLRPDYAKHLFNDYAPKFDASLKALGYQAPELLAAALLPRLTAPADILDLGCGTGLSGLPFKNVKGRLVGVDLAERMLREAEKLALYDQLICADLPPVLNSGEAWDIILAADVFVYVGDLAEVLSLIPAALKPMGLLAFTVEKAEAGEGPVLQESRRYAHPASYLNQLISMNGLRVAEVRDVVLRHDRGQPVQGQVWIVAKAL